MNIEEQIKEKTIEEIVISRCRDMVTPDLYGCIEELETYCKAREKKAVYGVEKVINKNIEKLLLTTDIRVTATVVKGMVRGGGVLEHT